jgi:hypothetical protein
MSFELKIKRKLVFTEKELNGLSIESSIQKLANYLLRTENEEVITDGNMIYGFSNKSVLYYQYRFLFSFEKENGQSIIRYEYNLLPVFKITLIMILFAAFFSKFSINNLLIFSAIFIILFFGFNIIYINSALKQMILNALMPESLNYEEKLSAEQKDWINNPDKCPACGEEISHFNYTCPECGLSINPKNKKKNVNMTGFYKIKFKYKLINPADEDKSY